MTVSSMLDSAGCRRSPGSVESAVLDYRADKAQGWQRVDCRDLLRSGQ